MTNGDPSHRTATSDGLYSDQRRETWIHAGLPEADDGGAIDDDSDTNARKNGDTFYASF